MSNALQVVASRQYAPTLLYPRCPTSPISDVFEIPDGYHGTLQGYAIPEDWCITFEEELCLCCCNLEYFPVLDDCLQPLGLYFEDCGGSRNICLPAGKYRALATDAEDDPVTPSINDVIIKISIMPGPCPAPTV